MTRLAFPLSLSVLALLAACATSDPVTPAPAPVIIAPPPVVTAPAGTVVVPPSATAPVVVPTPSVVRAGEGRIETITALPQTSAAAGGSTRPMRRLGIKMDDGTVQYVDTAAENLSLGERIELTRDGQIRH
jgi:hypothetical protein